jgi:pullulanase
MRDFYSYLDDFSIITVIMPSSYREDVNCVLKVEGNDEILDLNIEVIEDLGSEVKYTCRFDGYILLNQQYFVLDELGGRSELYTGRIVRTELFDDIYFYEENDLGSSYRRDRTKFKIWTPVAKYVRVEVVSKDGVREVHDMDYDNQGVWYLRLRGDYEGYRYRYIIYVNGKEHSVIDPYGRSSSAHAEYSYVIDPNKLVRMDAIKPRFSGNPTDAIIYETHIRDFTIDESIKVNYPGKYLGFIEEGTKSPKGHKIGIDHVSDLGITHVQLQPIFDFGDVDELDHDKHYNWGYNPEQYNVPEGWYSTDPNDPYKRINELRTLIDTLHKKGLRVTMDVVYNHVFDSEKFPFESIIPGYAYRYDDQGILTNSSGCGNDVASERKMIRKFIIDSVLYWTLDYKIDGFRFDLMGLHDIKLMNTLKQKLERYKKDVLVYGEGWNMPTILNPDNMAHMYNPHLLFTIGHFNDKFREVIKGATFNLKHKGYSMGSNTQLDDVINLVQGSSTNHYLFRYPSQSLNYVECHDNNTYFDKAEVALKDAPYSDRLKRQRLATSMVILSQGIPFIHTGQEFYRTKQGVENSYKSPDAINRVNWSLIDEHYADINFIKELIRIRKKYDLFRLQKRSQIRDHIRVTASDLGTIFYYLEDEKQEILVVFKNSYDLEKIELEHEYIMIFNGVRKSRKSIKKLIIDDVTTFILKRNK